VRDYLHIKDLTDACLMAIENFKQSSHQIFNLGSNQGNSILEVIENYERVFERKLHYKFVERRPGDVAMLVADSKKIYEQIGWKPKYGVKEIFEDYKMAINS
jgi:UDP-glucose 4-epimerase